MNLNLNYEGFEKNLFERYNDSCFEGIHYIFKFDNGYGASVIKHYGSYGCEEDLWELAVIEFYETDGGISYHLCYDTPITDDVIGYLTDREVCEHLQQIKDLSMDQAEGEKTKAFVPKDGVMMCDYPEDMQHILSYLESRGTLNVSVLELEKLYRDFSEECYCAGWMMIDDEVLLAFMRWLTACDV